MARGSDTAPAEATPVREMGRGTRTLLLVLALLAVAAFELFPRQLVGLYLDATHPETPSPSGSRILPTSWSNGGVAPVNVSERSVSSSTWTKQTSVPVAAVIMAATAPVAGSGPAGLGPVTSGLVAMNFAPSPTRRMARVASSASFHSTIRSSPSGPVTSRP